MTILIDLGTSRTAIAFLGDRQEWLPVSLPISSYARAGTASWGLFNDFVKGALNFYASNPGPHLVLFSRYAQVGSIVIPFSSDTKDCPLGVTTVPDLRDLVFTSIKEHWASAAAFLGVLGRFVAAYETGGAQWVVGRSAGGIDPRTLLPTGTLSFNEAVAVVYALMSLDVAGIRQDLENTFLLLADLGGGFLDISVAHDLKYQRNSGSAKIVSYGSYPLGVDRVGPRFSL